MVFPPEHVTESRQITEATTAPVHHPGHVSDRVIREIQDVARRRGWDPTAPAEPPGAVTPYALFCGALPEDLARRLVRPHRRQPLPESDR